MRIIADLAAGADGRRMRRRFKYKYSRGKSMFWAIISACSIVVAVLVVWVNASAFGMEERDHKELSEYEKRFGLGPQPAVKKDEASDNQG